MRESRAGVWLAGILFGIAFGPAIIVGSVAVFVWSHILKPVWCSLRDRARTRTPRLLYAVEAFTRLIVTFIGWILAIVTLGAILFMTLDGLDQVAMLAALPGLPLVHFFGYIGMVLFVTIALLVAGWWVVRRRRTAP